MRERPGSWLVVTIAAAVVVLAGLFGSWLPRLTQERATVLATPAPAGLFGRAEITVGREDFACLESVPFTPAATALQLVVLADRGQDVRFELTAAGEGYSAAQTVRTTGRGSDEVLTIAFPPPRRAVRGKLCVTGAAARAFKLVGTDEPRARSATTTTLNGGPVGSATLSLVDPRPTSLLGRYGAALDRAASLSGGVLPAWLLALLTAGVVLGFPVLALLAVWSARCEPRGQAGPEPADTR